MSLYYVMLNNYHAASVFFFTRKTQSCKLFCIRAQGTWKYGPGLSDKFARALTKDVQTIDARLTTPRIRQPTLLQDEVAFASPDFAQELRREMIQPKN